MFSVKPSVLADQELLPPRPSLAVLGEASNNPGMSKAIARKALQAQGARIALWRREKGWNRTTLAKRAAVTVTTIRGCEQGTKVTQPEKLRAILKALGRSLASLELDNKDPRVTHWTDEDYAIGNWYHNAPRAVKNWLWALQDISEVNQVLTDPLFVQLLEGWSPLTQDQKLFVLHTFDYIKKTPKTDDTSGGGDALAAADPKTRGPHR